ncbi:phage tail protein I [Paraburkholderia sp. G-4-1-8]|uniref:Phage tail protein I n=1 Tax=Paraburkholderia antibiotica TaxID=2728839 RepID=A0A7X9X6E3_9BURK|nr:phage tail protein I [Paraburkholderia antibiotica]
MTTSVLPPNATPLMRAIAAVNARLGELPVPLDSLKDPDAIPLNLLPWLAWELGVLTWSNDWPERIRRARVKAAIPIAMRAGTVGAVRRAVQSFGGNIALREWFQMDPPGKPHTFELTLTVAAQDGNPPTAAYIEDILREVDRAKALRSHYTFTQGISASATVGMVAGAQAVLYRRIAITDDLSNVLPRYSDGSPASDLARDAQNNGEADTVAALDALNATVTAVMPANSWSA